LLEDQALKKRLLLGSSGKLRNKLKKQQSLSAQKQSAKIFLKPLLAETFNKVGAVAHGSPLFLTSPMGGAGYASRF
jgi:hypothetical protein